MTDPNSVIEPDNHFPFPRQAHHEPEEKDESTLCESTTISVKCDDTRDEFLHTAGFFFPHYENYWKKNESGKANDLSYTEMKFLMKGALDFGKNFI